jgi:hypothetical protein
MNFCLGPSKIWVPRECMVYQLLLSFLIQRLETSWMIEQRKGETWVSAWQVLAFVSA